jgi:hypothetical protein
MIKRKAYHAPLVPSPIFNKIHLLYLRQQSQDSY